MKYGVQQLVCTALSLYLILAPVAHVSAHYTLGAQLPTSIGEVNAGGLPISPTSGSGNGELQYHVPPTWGGHVPGHIAFLMPGSLYIPPSDQNNYYSPDGAVLTDTVGDFFLYVCVSDFTEDSAPGHPDIDEQAGPINISWRRVTTETEKITETSYELSKFLYIAIPPEFIPPVDWTIGSSDVLTSNAGGGVTSNIETTITNDHNFIQTGKFGPRHPVAPNWWFIRITATPVDFPLDRAGDLTQLNPAFNNKYLIDPNYQGSSGFLYPPNMDPWLDRQISPENTNGVEKNYAGCYRVKILNMKAPSCAGKYFFKLFYTSTFQPFASMGILPWTSAAVPTPATSAIYGTVGGWPDLWQVLDSPYGEAYAIDPWSGYLNGYFEKYDSFWPENYPVILVKGEVDPGYVSGTVRYCGHSQYYYGFYYGTGVHTSGKVVAEGTAIDPITNQPIDRSVCAVGWFLGQLPGQGTDWKDRETGSEGLYEIEGLAAGIYTLTAYAAGFVPRTLATQVTVKRGQSIHGVDIYVCPTAKLQTKVYSKCPTGPVDWPRYVTMDGYPASLTILPVVPGGAEVRGVSPVGPDGVWYWATEGATTAQAKNIWADINSQGTPYNSPTDLGNLMNAYDTDAEMAAIANKYGWAWQELVDANGTVVAWQDFTFDIAQDARTFGTFWGDPSCYSGIETLWDGHVPTFLADFTSGILPGQYRVRTWVYGYVQTKEYVVDFPAVEFPGTAYMEMDLFKGGTINATVHFHQQEIPSAEMTDAQFDATPEMLHLVIEAYDANGVLQAWNSTDNGPWFSDFDNSHGQSLVLIGDSMAWFLEGRVHGMPEGTYTLKAYLRNFVQQEFPQTTVQYCTNGSLSFHLIRGALFNVTVYSRDCQDPSQPVNWAQPGHKITVVCTSDHEEEYSSDKGEPQDGTVDFVRIEGIGGSGDTLLDYLITCGDNKPQGLPSGVYSITAYTPGYVQLQVPKVYAIKGSSTADVPIYLLVGPEIRVVIDFKTELIPAPLPDDFYSYYFRIEVLDENGTLAAANITAIPQKTFATHSQYPWPGALNPAQPFGVQTWVFQLHGFAPSTSPTNTPNWIGPSGNQPFVIPPTGNDFDQYPVYNDGSGKPSGDHDSYGIMWGRTYTIVVTEENQIGYIQLATVTATPTCKGITTVIFEMDRMARLAGQVFTRNFMGDFRAGSWQTTTAQGATATVKAWGPYDGYYYTYVRPDTYTITTEGPGYKSGSRTVVATWGGVASGQDFYLEESGIPIPEFPAASLLTAISAIATATMMLRRQHRNMLHPIGHDQAICILTVDEA